MRIRCLLRRRRKFFRQCVWRVITKNLLFRGDFLQGESSEESAIFYMRPTCPKKVRTTSGMSARRKASAISSRASVATDASLAGASQLQPPSWLHVVSSEPCCISSSIRRTLNKLKQKTKNGRGLSTSPVSTFQQVQYTSKKPACQYFHLAWKSLY